MGQPRSSTHRGSHSIREPVIRINPLHAEVYIAVIDLGREEVQLGIALILHHVDVPRPRPMVGDRIPTIATRFEDVLELIGRAFSPYPPKRRTRSLQETSEPRHS